MNLTDSEVISTRRQPETITPLEVRFVPKKRRSTGVVEDADITQFRCISAVFGAAANPEVSRMNSSAIDAAYSSSATQFSMIF